MRRTLGLFLLDESLVALLLVEVSKKCGIILHQLLSLHIRPEEGILLVNICLHQEISLRRGIVLVVIIQMRIGVPLNSSESISMHIRSLALSIAKGRLVVGLLGDY
jgi:hypothetical protein